MASALTLRKQLCRALQRTLALPSAPVQLTLFDRVGATGMTLVTLTSDLFSVLSGGGGGGGITLASLLSFGHTSAQAHAFVKRFSRCPVTYKQLSKALSRGHALDSLAVALSAAIGGGCGSVMLSRDISNPSLSLSLPSLTPLPIDYVSPPTSEEDEQEQLPADDRRRLADVNVMKTYGTAMMTNEQPQAIEQQPDTGDDDDDEKSRLVPPPDKAEELWNICNDCWELLLRCIRTGAEQSQKKRGRVLCPK